MHELSITEHLLAQCLEEAGQQNASAIRAVHLCIGRLRGILPECIQVYWELLAEGTIAEGARIEAEFLPVQVRCRDCGQAGEITPHRLACPPLRQPAPVPFVRKRILYQEPGGRHKWKLKSFIRS